MGHLEERNICMEKVEYLIKPWIEKRSVNILAGRSGAGKTHLLMQLISDYKNLLPPILYLAADQAAASYTPIREKYGLGDDQIIFYSRIDEMTKLPADKAEPLFFDSQGSYKWLRQMHEKHSECRIVICDPGQSFVPTKRLNDQTSVIGGMGVLCRWTKRSDTSLILTWHTNKRHDDIADVFDQLSGSHAVLGHSSTKALLTAPPPALSANHVLYVRGKAFEDQVQELERSKTDGKFIFLASPSTMALALYAEIGSVGGMMNIDEMRKLELCSERTLYRTLDMLVSENMLIRVSRGVYRIKAAT